MVLLDYEQFLLFLSPSNDMREKRKWPIRDRSFFMREGGLVGFGGGHSKKIGLKGGASRKKMKERGGGRTKKLD